MRYVAKAVLLGALVVFPALAQAQQITGVVRDGSGAILPGVTVEAASPVLIEKLRTAVTDGTGQYRISDLPPGAYSVTYTLPGFVTIKRDGVEISTGVTVTLNTDMRVGGIQETITVTGETPVVDVQSSTRVQRVLDNDLVAALPASRGYGNLLMTISAIQATGLSNTGVVPAMNFFTSRGGRSNEGTMQIDGMNVGSAFNGGGISSYGYDTGNAAEVQVTVAGGLGEVDRGGPQFNLVPKTGGNNFSGTYFGNIAGKWSQGNNLNDELRSFGILDPAEVIRSWDTSFALGGPIKRDRLWFFGVLRTMGAYTGIAGFYGNANVGNANLWTYVPDRNVKQRSMESKKIAGVRLTGQVTQRNKVSAYFDYQKVCNGGAFAQDAEQCRGRGDDWVAVGAFGNWAPEASHVWDDREKITQTSWTSPVTNKLLLEAGFSQYLSNWGGQTPAGALDQAPFIPVSEQSVVNSLGQPTGVPVANFLYHGFAGLGNNYQSHNVWRASATYVTGAHNLKVGYQAAYEVTNLFGNYATHGLQYRFNAGVPNQITQRITPWQQGNRTRYDGFYIQDQWTYNRLTLQGGLRYEHAWSFFPEGQSGLLEDSVFGGAKRTFPSAKGVTGYNDVAPRMGLAYDVFGNGKTAFKLNLAKYWQSAANDGIYIASNVASTFAQTTTRAWVDGNGNFAPDCSLQSGLNQDNRASGGDLCGPWDNALFGSLGSATALNPKLLNGWNIRPFDWQFSASVQHELLPRVSAEFGYSRRSWGNFTYTDNRAVGPQDFDTLTITAPTHADLPGSGQPASYSLLKQAAFGRVDNYLTLGDDYGDSVVYWQGLDLVVNARTNSGVNIQGGFTTGAGTWDICDVTNALPELFTQGTLPFAQFSTQRVDSCAINQPWTWNWRGLTSYTVPRIDVLVSAVLRSQANVAPTNNPGSVGATQRGDYIVSNATAQAILGRPLAGGAQNVTLDLALPGEVFPDRINTIDMRFAKIIRLGRTRSNVGIDLYNLFNSNTGTTFNQVFGANGAAWLRPTAILNARFVRFNATVDF